MKNEIDVCNCFWADTGHCLCPVSCKDYKEALRKDNSEESKIALEKINHEKTHS
jgi:hypothetical protein